MKDKAEKILRVFVLALVAVVVLKLLGVAIKLIISVGIPILVVYFLYRILIKKEDVFR